jgi:hypothetical protein
MSQKVNAAGNWGTEQSGAAGGKACAVVRAPPGWRVPGGTVRQGDGAPMFKMSKSGRETGDEQLRVESPSQFSN